MIVVKIKGNTIQLKYKNIVSVFPLAEIKKNGHLGIKKFLESKTQKS